MTCDRTQAQARSTLRSRCLAHALVAGLISAGALGTVAAQTATGASGQPTAAATRPGADAWRLASPEARQVIQWVRYARDNQHKPFIVIDKKRALVMAFDAQGRLRGSAPALMGAARGDHSVPGIGERPLASILPEERTTPAGRFMAEMGRNAKGEDIVWVDYDAAVSLHRVRANNKAERRLERLASATPEDNRISYGCINVPRTFYENVVHPLVSRQGAGRAVVYVMPEVLPVTMVFPRLALRAGATLDAPA